MDVSERFCMHALVSGTVVIPVVNFFFKGETQEAARLFKQALDQGRTTYYPPSHLPRSLTRLKENESDSKFKDIGSRRSSFSSIVRIQNAS